MTTHSIYLGTEIGITGTQLPQDFVEVALSVIKRSAATRFGGFTLYRTEGGWMTPKGILHEEKGVRIDVVDRASGEVEEFARWAGKCLQQMSVLVSETDGKHTFVEVAVKEAA